MAIIHETDGDKIACDGCGRIDSEAARVDVRAIQNDSDPNINQDIQHHFCVQCAKNRGLSAPA